MRSWRRQSHDERDSGNAASACSRESRRAPHGELFSRDAVRNRLSGMTRGRERLSSAAGRRRRPARTTHIVPGRRSRPRSGRPGSCSDWSASTSGGGSTLRTACAWRQGFEYVAATKTTAAPFLLQIGSSCADEHLRHIERRGGAQDKTDDCPGEIRSRRHVREQSIDKPWESEKDGRDEERAKNTPRKEDSPTMATPHPLGFGLRKMG